MLKLYTGLFAFWFAGTLAAQTFDPSKTFIFEVTNNSVTVEVTCWVIDEVYPTEETARQAMRYFGDHYFQILAEEDKHHRDAARARGEVYHPLDETTYDKGRTVRLLDNLDEKIRQKYGCELYTHSSDG